MWSQSIRPAADEQQSGKKIMPGRWVYFVSGTRVI